VTPVFPLTPLRAYRAKSAGGGVTPVLPLTPLAPIAPNPPEAAACGPPASLSTRLALSAAAPSRSLLCGRALSAFEEVVDQFRTRVPHLDVERLHPIGEVVEHHHGGDGDEQTHGGGHQRF